MTAPEKFLDINHPQGLKPVNPAYVEHLEANLRKAVFALQRIERMAHSPILTENRQYAILIAEETLTTLGIEERLT